MSEQDYYALVALGTCTLLLGAWALGRVLDWLASH